MSASKILKQMVRLIEEGRATEEDAASMLEASRVQLTIGSLVGGYQEGMLCVGEGLHGLDPLSISAFSMPEAWTEHKAEVRADAQAEAKFKADEAAEAARIRAIKTEEQAAKAKAEADAEAAKAKAEADAEAAKQGKTIDASAESKIPFTGEGSA